MACSHGGWLVAAMMIATVGPASAAPAIDADPKFAASYMKGFIAGCRTKVPGDPDIGKIACACAAAIMADRFTVDEITSLRDKRIGEFDKLHSGTSRLIGICIGMAKASVAN